MIILPSLEIVPAKYNGNILLSQIPIDGSGDFTVTRALNTATRVNALGNIEIVDADRPRIDYPIGGGCPALLVEPSATNLTVGSNSFSVETAPVATVVQNQVDIFGNPNSAWLLSGADNSGDTPSANNVRKITAGTVSGSTYAGAIYIKSPTGAPVTFNFRQGTTTTSTVASGNGWFRAVNVSVATTQFRSIFYTTGGEPIIMCHHQVELGSVPTSYIPVGGTAVTRSADIIRKTGITSLIGQSEGTVYFELEVTDEARNKWFCSIDSASNSFIQGWINTSRQINVQIQNGGITVMSTLISSALPVGYHKVAFAYNAATNGCEMFVNGVQNPVASRTVTGAGLPAFNNFTFGGYLSTTTDALKAHVRAGALYTTRLSNTQLALLTSPYTSYSQMASALSYTLG